MKLAITIVQLLCGLALVCVIILQSGKNSGLSGTIGGNSSDNFAFNTAKSKTLDAKLARWTKWIALAFVILTFVLNLL